MAQPPAAGSRQPASGAVEGADASSGNPTKRIQVYGSVLVPSKKLLAQMKFRPWGGVFLRRACLGAQWPGWLGV